jgi:UDP-N-acetylmuramoyl-L-alanyl-D-glutamate--2,6-diaminopimelate ligase
MKLNAMIGRIPGEVSTRGDTDIEIAELCVDSRKVTPGALFFCTPGLHMDAHDFAPQAVEKGASALVDQRFLPLDVPQVKVEDVRVAVSYIASEYFGNPSQKLMMLGITGTKGKTTTSFLV